LTEANVEYGIAESIYQGDFLEEDLYDEWPRAKREYLRVIYLEITERLIKNHLLRSDYTAASVLCRKVLNRDNCQEQVHRLLIQCYLAQGQRHMALRQYQTCVETLRKELEIEPTAATIALYKEISHGGSNNT
jgi:DNA-binding SARP family transcriptional activator